MKKLKKLIFSRVSSSQKNLKSGIRVVCMPPMPQMRHIKKALFFMAADEIIHIYKGLGLL